MMHTEMHISFLWEHHTKLADIPTMDKAKVV